jgi:hypothetical protein
MKNSCVSMNHKAPVAFTLVEIMLSLAVLLLLVVLFAEMISRATAITRIDSRHVDTDTQARGVLDRISADIGRMLKRTDLDYYVKQPTGYNGHGNGHAYGHKVQTGQPVSDQIAFFCQTPGYPDSGFTATSPEEGTVSLVAYRVNDDDSTQPGYLQLARMSKGLLWNSVSNNSNLNNQGTKLPLVFLPQTIAGMGKPWYAAVNSDTSTFSRDQQYEVIGPDVFRFEYYYLLKSGAVKGEPWDVTVRTTQQTVNTVSVSGNNYWAPIGLGDVQAIAVAVAVIDRANRLLVNSVSSTALLDLASDLADFKDAKGLGNPAQKIGEMEDSWNQTLATVTSQGVTSSGSRVPPEAAKAIHVYSRYIDIGWQ